MMMKYFYVLTIMITSLHAEIAPEKLQDIYFEAALFVFVGIVMSVVSYKVSSKNAAAYAIKNQKNIEAKAKEDKEIIKSKEGRLEELMKMLDDNTITEDEFRMLKQRMYNTEV